MYYKHSCGIFLVTWIHCYWQLEGLKLFYKLASLVPFSTSFMSNMPLTHKILIFLRKLGYLFRLINLLTGIIYSANINQGLSYTTHSASHWAHNSGGWPVTALWVLVVIQKRQTLNHSHRNWKPLWGKKSLLGKLTWFTWGLREEISA